jgi:hypothetical protein
MLQPKRVKVSWRPLVVGWWPGDANLKASTIKNQAIVRSETDVALNGCICLTFHFVIEDYLQHSLNVKVGWCDALRVFSRPTQDEIIKEFASARLLRDLGAFGEGLATPCGEQSHIKRMEAASTRSRKHEG